MESGIGWTLTGHSERRTAGESNELVAAKTLYALQSSMKVVPCVGEQIEQRESGSTFDVVASQVGAIASAIESSGGDVEEMWSRTVIAYEPVWAIGTGLTATPTRRRRCTPTCATGSRLACRLQSPMPPASCTGAP